MRSALVRRVALHGPWALLCTSCMLTMSHVVILVCLITYMLNCTPCGRGGVGGGDNQTNQDRGNGRRFDVVVPGAERSAAGRRDTARAQGWPWTSAPQRRSACARSGATPKWWRPRELPRCAFAPHGAQRAVEPRRALSAAACTRSAPLLCVPTLHCSRAAAHPVRPSPLAAALACRRMLQQRAQACRRTSL